MVKSLGNAEVNTTKIQEEFFSNLEGLGKSYNTIKNYRTDIRCFNNYLIKKQNSLDITHFNYKKACEYGAYIRDRYNSTNSRRRRVQTLRLFFDFLMAKEMYRENPIRKLSPSPKSLNAPQPPSLLDIQKLWLHLLSTGNKEQKMDVIIKMRNQVIFVLIYTSGLKVSDLTQLKVNHIDNTLGSPRVLVTPPKRDPYSVPIHQVFNEIFPLYQEAVEKGKEANGLEFDELFFNANPFKMISKGLSARGLEVIFEGFRKTLHIQMTPKSLRQAAIFNWMRKDHSQGLIKEWLGIAPSYSLKLYEEHLKDLPYNDNFLLSYRDITIQ